jgi:hypothetical protein
LDPKSWRIGVPFFGARRPSLGHKVMALIAASFARTFCMEWLLG